MQLTWLSNARTSTCACTVTPEAEPDLLHPTACCRAAGGVPVAVALLAFGPDRSIVRDALAVLSALMCGEGAMPAWRRRLLLSPAQEVAQMAPFRALHAPRCAARLMQLPWHGMQGLRPAAPLLMRRRRRRPSSRQRGALRRSRESCQAAALSPVHGQRLARWDPHCVSSSVRILHVPKLALEHGGPEKQRTPPGLPIALATVAGTQTIRLDAASRTLILMSL